MALKHKRKKKKDKGGCRSTRFAVIRDKYPWHKARSDRNKAEPQWKVEQRDE